MSHRQLIVCGSLLLSGGLACWYFPLFHIRPIKSESSELAQNAPAKAGARKLDTLAAYATGTDVMQLWNAFDADLSKANSQYGRQAGLGGAWYFRVQGTGIVDSIEKNRLVLSIANSPRRVSLDMGVVVDSTVREAIGVKASEFANSQDFNAVSTELNRQVEQDVIAPNRERLTPGVSVSFVGCAKINGKSDLDPLRLIPIRIEILESEPYTAEHLPAEHLPAEHLPAEKSP